MISFIRKRLSYANAAVTAALVFAMAGGAFAASDGTVHSSSHSVHYAHDTRTKKGKKANVLRGPRGPRGPAGPAGPAGERGSQGLPGKDGTSGANGTAGSNGKGVVIAEVPQGQAACEGRGGTSFEVEGSGTKAYACNGQTGYVEKLPSGKTEKGVWSVGSGTGLMAAAGVALLTEKENVVIEGKSSSPHEFLTNAIVSQQTEANLVTTASVSFPVEVSPAPTTTLVGIAGGAEGVKVENGAFSIYKPSSKTAQEDWKEACPGSASNPEAKPGFLCIYLKEGTGFGLVGSGAKALLEVAHPFGINLPFEMNKAVGFHLDGAWAVTAE